MSAIIAIDESGNTGHGGRFFVMAAIIADNPRILKGIYSSLPTSKSEPKFHSAYPEAKRRVLVALSQLDVKIVFVTIDKYSSEYNNIRGNDLYQAVLFELLKKSAIVLKRNDVGIYLDSISSVTANEFSKMAESVFSSYRKNVRRSIKVDSVQYKCIQLVDFVAGSIRRAYECHDTACFEIIMNKVSVARGL